MVEAAKAQQLEGVMAKRLGSPYVPGKRTDAWRKIKLRQTQDCVILGFTPGQGGRGATFGALLVGAYDDDRLRWVGQVGSGLTEALLERLLADLQDLVRPEPAVEELSKAKGAVFVEPALVCEVDLPRDDQEHREDARAGVPTDARGQDPGRLHPRTTDSRVAR